MKLYSVGVSVESDYDDWDSSILVAANSKSEARAIAKDGAWDCFEEYEGRLIHPAGRRVQIGRAEEFDMDTPGILGHSGQW